MFQQIACQQYVSANLIDVREISQSAVVWTVSQLFVHKLVFARVSCIVSKLFLHISVLRVCVWCVRHAGSKNFPRTILVFPGTKQRSITSSASLDSVARNSLCLPIDPARSSKAPLLVPYTGSTCTSLSEDGGRQGRVHNQHRQTLRIELLRFSRCPSSARFPTSSVP